MIIMHSTSPKAVRVECSGDRKWNRSRSRSGTGPPFSLVGRRSAAGGARHGGDAPYGCVYQ
eukprot:9380085-Pyramimonas_sp.AAC.1